MSGAGGRKAAVAAPYGLHQPSGIPSNPELMTIEILKHCDSEKTLHQSLRFLWNADLWLKFFNECIHKNRGMLLALRKLVQIGTIDAVLRGRYFLPNGASVLLDKKDMQRAADETRCYASSFEFPSFPSLAGQTTTPVLIIDGDCIETGLWLKSKGLRTSVLNMASASHPGGGYRAGMGAQEENLHRRSNLFQCLEDPYHTQTARKWSYPLPEFGGVFSPLVTVFRHSESKGYAFFEQPQQLSFISIYAYHNPPVDTNDAGELRLSRSIASHMRRKIEAIFNIAAHNGQECLVLGALGCGAYCNPPKHVAQLFQEVLRSKFPNTFKLVVFSIIDDHNAHKEHNPEGNIKPFADVFAKGRALKLEDAKMNDPLQSLPAVAAQSQPVPVPPAAAAAPIKPAAAAIDDVLSDDMIM